MVNLWKLSRKTVKDAIRYHENALYFHQNVQEIREKYRGQTIVLQIKEFGTVVQIQRNSERKLGEEPRINEQIFVHICAKRK